MVISGQPNQHTPPCTSPGVVTAAAGRWGDEYDWSLLPQARQLGARQEPRPIASKVSGRHETGRRREGLWLGSSYSCRHF